MNTSYQNTKKIKIFLVKIIQIFTFVKVRYILYKKYIDRNNKYINIDIDINSIILDYKILCKIIYIMIFIINMSYIIQESND